jgi:integrase
MKCTMVAKVRAYLAERRALGFQLRIDGYHLLNFARYVDGLGHRGPITRALALRWACLPKEADRLYWAHRLGIVRTFARRLAQSEPRTQVPPRHLLGPDHRRPCPYLYSPAQLRTLLRRAAALSGRLRPHTWQCLLGLLACTGLRISEALRLKVEDVDWQQACLMVRESKCRQARIVPLHPSALKPLRAYARRRDRRFPLVPSFFVSERGTPLAYKTVQHTFAQLRRGLTFRRRPPRLHDLRHTVASRVLHRWQASPRGAANRILILARYLGHDRLDDTYWYLTAMPPLLAQAAQRFELPEHAQP